MSIPPTEERLRSATFAPIALLQTHNHLLILLSGRCLTVREQAEDDDCFILSEPLKILSATPVTNSASAESGTVSVLFAIPGLSFSLSTPTTLNIISNANEPDTGTLAAPSAPQVNTPPPTPTTGTTTTAPPPASIVTANSITTTISDTASAGLAGVQGTTISALPGGISSKLSPEYVGFDISSDRVYMVFPKDQHLRQPSVSRGTLQRLLVVTVVNSFAMYSSSPAVSYTPVSSQSTNTTTRANTVTTAAVSTQRGMPRAAVIALVVILPLFALVLAISLCYWRRHTRHRSIDLLLAHAWRSAMESASPVLTGNRGGTLPAAGDLEAGAAVPVVVAGEKGSSTHLPRPPRPPPSPPPLSPLPPSPSSPPSPPPAYVP
ncbi:hypothetical protein GGX14DRAFT_406031 [Mycena pura]|uniref:Uncharacterized protein n=1 Tax=Mycena pura TaxID=153505 RepID=A0AAD6URD1_9AGAR|nr:hypothetical protein GGX14DRAFT_406031 [Mycena pura]